jgi:hypothetical protein
MIVGLTACNEMLSPDPTTLGYDYFPLSTGDTRIYDVTLIEHNVDLSSDTTYYQLKEVVGELFTAGGQDSYRIERFTRSNDTEGWQVDSVWIARRNTYQAIVVENNIPIIKLSFPVQEDRRWDGNAMNSREYDEFKMINTGKSFELAGAAYDRTVELVKEDALDPTQKVSDNLHKEIFAYGIGMIYRIDVDRKYCNFNDCPNTVIIEFGREVEYKLIDYQVVN